MENLREVISSPKRLPMIRYSLRTASLAVSRPILTYFVERE